MTVSTRHLELVYSVITGLVMTVSTRHMSTNIVSLFSKFHRGVSLSPFYKPLPEELISGSSV